MRVRIFLICAIFFNQAVANDSLSEGCKKFLILSGVVVHLEVGGLSENIHPTRDVSSQITETQNNSESIFLRTDDPNHLPEVGQFVFKYTIARPDSEPEYLKCKVVGKNENGTFQLFNFEHNFRWGSATLEGFSRSDHSQTLLEKRQETLSYERRKALENLSLSHSPDREFLYKDQFIPSFPYGKSREQEKADDISDTVRFMTSGIQDEIFGMHEVFSDRKEEVESVQYKFLHIIERLSKLHETYVDEEFVKKARKDDPAAYPEVTIIEGLYTHVPDLIPPKPKKGDYGYRFEDLKNWVDRFYENIDKNLKEKAKRISEFDKKSDQINVKINEAKKTLIAKYKDVLEHEKSIKVYDQYHELKKRFDDVFSKVDTDSSSKAYWVFLKEKLFIPLLKKLKESEKTKENEKKFEGTNYSSVIEGRVESPYESNPYDFYTLIHFMRQDKRFSKETVDELEKMVDEYKRKYDASPLYLIRSLKADYELLRGKGWFPEESRQKLLEKIATDSYSKEEEAFKRDVSDSLKSIGKVNEYWKGLSLDRLSRESQERGENYKNFQITESPGYSEFDISPDRHRHIQRHFQEESLRELEPIYYKLKAKVDLGKLTPEEFTSEFQIQLDERVRKKVEYFKDTTGKEKHTVFPFYISSREVFEALGKSKSFVEWKKYPKPAGPKGHDLSDPNKKVYAWDGWIVIKGQRYNVIVLAQHYHDRVDRVGIVTLYPLSGPGVVSF